MSINSITLHGPERWITQIVDGVVTLIQRIDADAVVVQLQDLPLLAASDELVGDHLASEIMRALEARKG